VNRAGRAERLLLGLTDAALVAGAFAAAYVLRFWYEIGAVVSVPPADPASYAKALAVVLAVFALVLASRGLYDAIPLRGIDVVEVTIESVTLAAALVLAASFFYREFTYSRSVSVIAWGMCAALLPLPRLAILYGRRRRWRRGERLTPAVIVGSRRRARDLAERLRARAIFGVAVGGVIVRQDDDPTLELPTDLPVLGPVARLGELVREHGAREVLVTDDLGRLELLEAIEVCEALEVEARVVPCIYDLFVVPGDLAELHGVPFVSIRERRFALLSRAWKRLVDLVVGGALLLLALPLLLGLAWRVRRESPGAALFRQERIGEGGRPFMMWKLRTMVADAEAQLGELLDVEALPQPVFKLERDPRITPTGRWLRRWSLDELPQLWNVVKGDMSLVGPRPEEAPVVARYDAHHRRRLKAKPGLTGLQQIHARATTDIDERVRLDVFYIRRRSFLFDLWILARTPSAVLRGEGAR